MIEAASSEATWFSGLNLMSIPLKFADSLNFKRVGKQLFSRDFHLSLAKRSEKLLVKTRPMTQSFII